MVDLPVAPPRKAARSLRLDSDTQLGEELPRLAHILNLREGNAAAAAALNGHGSAGPFSIGRRLRSVLQPRLAARLAPRLRRKDAFSRGEQWLVETLFSQPDAITQRSMHHMLLACAQDLRQEGRLAEARHVYHALLARTELGEPELAQALLAVLKAGDDELVDLYLDRLVAAAAPDNRPPPATSGAVRYVRLLNSILKRLRRAGEIERAQTFVFGYLARFDDLATSPDLPLTLRRFVRDLRRAGRPMEARRVQRLLAPARADISGGTYLVPRDRAAGSGRLAASVPIRLLRLLAPETADISGGTYLVPRDGAAGSGRLAASVPDRSLRLLASLPDRSLRLDGLLRSALDKVRSAGGLNGATAAAGGAGQQRSSASAFARPARLASRFIDCIEHAPATDTDAARRLHGVLREVSSLEPDEVDELAAILSRRIEAAMASSPVDAHAAEPVLELCRALLKRHHLDAAKLLTGAIAGLAADSAELLGLRAYVEKWMWNLEEAVSLYRRALALPGCDPTIHFELAEALEFLGDDYGAIAAIEAGLAQCKEDELFLKAPGYLAQIAGPLMRQGRIAEGWAAMQKRRDRYVLDPPCKLWTGERLREETLLILSEQGIGDEIRYASCYPDLLERVGKIAVSADPRLCGLLARSFPDVSFVPNIRGAASGWRAAALERKVIRLSRALSLDLFCFATAVEYLCMAGDLPLYLRRTRDAFPRHGGYLLPDPEKRQMWRARLDGLGPGLKVGLSWRSASAVGKRSQHYFSIEELLPLLHVEGVHFVNLQYDDCEAELARLEDRHGVAVHRWPETDLKNDLDGVAALMKELDLVIAPHTMVKELAGAVGTPTLFMAPTGQAWVRWRADPDSGADIWHPSLCHIHSARAGDKREVVGKAAARLREIVAERGPAGTWSRHAGGRHAGSAEPEAATQDVPEAATADPQIFTNAFGETYQPAGTKDIADRQQRREEWERREASFRESFAMLFAGVQQPTRPKGVLMVSCQRSLKHQALTMIPAHGLLRKGWAVVSLEQESVGLPRVADEDIAYFHEILFESGEKREFRHREHGEGLRFEWEVDWDRRLCRAYDVNFYGIIANRLGKEFKRYVVDISDPAVAERFETLLQTCDAALGVCADAEERFGRRGVPVRITALEQNYPPGGVFKVYCSDRGYKFGVEFVELREAYEMYFRGGRTDLVGAVEAQNVTRHRLYSAAGLRRDQFDAWLDCTGDDPAVVARAQGWVKQDRSGHGKPTVEGEQVLDRIRRHKATGGRVACLYGCVLFDFGHPWLDDGPAHVDMIDWYNHTVATLAGTDTLLLVKPHPSETDIEFFGRPEKCFIELLEAPIPANLALLGHRWLNNADLMPLLDFGIVWRGSIATELALMGIPPIVCAPYAMTDHVLDFVMPRGRADYEDMLRNSGRLRVTDELKHRAAMIFEFYRTEVMIEYPFGWFPSKRGVMGPPVLSQKALQAYLENGHPSIDRICELFTE